MDTRAGDRGTGAAAEIEVGGAAPEGRELNTEGDIMAPLAISTISCGEKTELDEAEDFRSSPSSDAAHAAAGERREVRAGEKG